MAVGRITGPLLKQNLLRDGVNLAFETDLLYIDVINGRIGIKTSSPQFDLDVNGTTRTTILEVNTQATIGVAPGSVFTLSGNTIANSNTTLYLQPSGTGAVVYQGKLLVNNNLQLTNNAISTTVTDAALNINTLGTGVVNINSDMLVNGNLHATGNITADGDIQIGSSDQSGANEDTVTFYAEIASDIIPDQTDFYDLGSDPLTGGKAWGNAYLQNVYTDNLIANSLVVNGIDLTLPQGNIVYVAVNGLDTNAGLHENDPVLTIKHALTLAAPGTTVYVYPGTYEEIFPLTIPAGVAIRGAGLRSVKIVPTTATRYNDAILLNGETTVEDLTIADFFSGGNYFTVVSASSGSTTVNVGTAPFAHTYVSGGTINISGTDYNITNAVYTYTTGVLVLTHTGGTASGTVFLSALTFDCDGDTRVFPDNGYAFRFANDFTVTTRSPYIRNLTVITAGSVTSPSDPRGFNSGDAGKGIYADGAYALSTSNKASMLFHTVTLFTPGVDAVTLTNGVRIEWLNSFAYFASRGMYAFSSVYGFARQGATRLRIDTRVGTWAVGNTVTYYGTNGSTVLASGVIESIDGNFVNLTGRNLGFETITDRAGKTVYAQGNAKLSTAVKKFGTASLALDGTGDYLSISTQPDFAFPSTARLAKTITVNGTAAISATQSKFGGSSIEFSGANGTYLGLASNTDFGFGTGDFTIEGWFYKTTTTTKFLFDTRTSLTENSIAVQSSSSNTLRLYVNGAFLLTTGTAHTSNAWNHLAISRASGVTRFFINGVVTGSVSDTTNYGSTKPLVVGALYNGTTAFAGYIDDFRVSNTARYTTTFTPTTTAFVDDVNTKLLVNGNSSIADNVGGTATDFTLEAWIYPTAGSTYHTIFDFRSVSTEEAIYLGINLSDQIYLYVNGVVPITTAAVSISTWTHVAVVRYNSITKIYVNGTQSGSSWTDITNYGTTKPLRIGADFNGNYGFTGYIDDVRISKGVARYTTTFTAPTIALTGDLGTVLLLHFNGTNNSTTFLDDGITFQDVRTSAGGTATLINFADYADFGAEIRAIGSAIVYGTYGAYGDGVGVTAYLISQNFAYVGAGKLVTNDPNDRIAANEVTELNGAKIYYTSVDNEGNFSVGDSFYVNQKTGEVLFNNQALTITTATGVVFTDGVHTTTITSTDITTGNIIIYDNNIDSLTGNINVSSASGVINLQNTTNVTGDLTVTGDVNIGGNITIGDASTDAINFVGSINSDLIPATTAFYNIGTDLLRWKTAFLNRVEIDDLVIDNNTISTTNGDDDLTLIANGTGRIYVPSSDVQINQNLTVTQDFTVSTGTSYLKNVTVVGDITQTGDINQTGNFVTSGNTQVTGNITGTGYVQLPEIRISGNTISTTTTNRDLQLTPDGVGDVVFEGIKVNDNNIRSTATNSDITLVPQGTGQVIVNSNQSVKIPVGDNSQRPATATNGMMRYNTQLNRYEGYSNGYWTKLGGIQDVDGNTYILAEATPGANDNVLYFYADNTLTATIDSTKLFTTRFQTANLDLQSNTISPITIDSNLNLTTTGTGGVRLGNLKIFNNTITNIVAGAVTEFSETGAGYVKISGVNGVVIPSGDTLNDRPLVPEVGMMRFNTDGNLVEVYNGVTWTSVAGSSGGVTTAEANEIGITSALIFG